MHWKSLHDNPNSPEVRSLLRTELSRLRKGRVGDSTQFLRDFVTGRSVLDVGVVQHDLNQTRLAHWKHGQICQHASRAVGIDILPNQVAELGRRGFDVRCVDATGDADLGERFERVHLGDVIEHVDNPVSLLSFAGRHLASGGRILCSTPNPFFVSYVLEGLRSGSYIPNADHVAWITPTMALELAHRASLELEGYWHCQGDGKTLARKLAVGLISVLGIRDSEPLSPTFFYVFVQPARDAHDRA